MAVALLRMAAAAISLDCIVKGLVVGFIRLIMHTKFTKV